MDDTTHYGRIRAAIFAARDAALADNPDISNEALRDLGERVALENGCPPEKAREQGEWGEWAVPGKPNR